MDFMRRTLLDNETLVGLRGAFKVCEPMIRTVPPEHHRRLFLLSSSDQVVQRRVAARKNDSALAHQFMSKVSRCTRTHQETSAQCFESL